MLQLEQRESISPSSIFLSVEDQLRPTNTGEDHLLYSVHNSMLIPSRNTQKHLRALWSSLGPTNETHKIHHHNDLMPVP